jgi:hypothetical protein
MPLFLSVVSCVAGGREIEERVIQLQEQSLDKTILTEIMSMWVQNK